MFLVDNFFKAGHLWVIYGQQECKTVPSKAGRIKKIIRYQQNVRKKFE